MIPLLNTSVTVLASEDLTSEYLRLKYVLIRPNKMQQYAGTYLLQNNSTSFGCPSHPSSGVHKL